MENRLDIDTGLRFFFRDPQWGRKLLIGGLLQLTLIGGIPLAGWALEIQRRALRGENEPLPEWDDWGKYIVDGLKMWLVQVVWGLPLIILWVVTFFPMMVLLLGADTSSPPNEALFLGISALFFCAMPFLAIFGLALYLFWPLYSGILADTGDILQALNPLRVFKLLRASFWQTALAGLFGYMAIYAASMVGMMLLFIGMFFLAPIGLAIMHHFFGQAYRIARAKLPAAEPAAPQLPA